MRRSFFSRGFTRMNADLKKTFLILIRVYLHKSAADSYFARVRT